MRNWFCGGTLAAFFLTAPLQAQSLDDVAARYGVRASVLDISLSPSGNKIVWISAGPEHSEIVNVVDLSNGQVRQIANNTDQIADMTWCAWASEQRIICEIVGMGTGPAGMLIPFSRLFAIGDDGTDVNILSERRSNRALGFSQDGGSIVALDVAEEDGSILMTREYIKERSTGTRLANEQEGLGVDQIDTRNGRRKIVERPDVMASRFIADENGALRIKVRRLTDNSGYLTGETLYYYKDADKRGWQELEDVYIDGVLSDDFKPAAVDASRNVIVGYDKVNGFDAIVEVPIGAGNNAKVVMARSDVDVGGLIRIGRKQRVVGAAFATEKPEVKYFDTQLAQLAKGLAQALPNQPVITIVGASADESKLLIEAGSDTDPGTIYLYDQKARNLQQLLAVREYLVNQPMGEMKPVSYPAADGTAIPGYLTLPAGSDGKNLPAIVMPHGGPGSRDVWGFDWLAQFFAARGYAVLQPNFRGSAGYGDAWYGRNGFQAWETSIGDVNDAGRWLVDQGVADPQKLAIVGWSYGGYAALQSQVMDPDLFKAVAAIAPVADLEFWREDWRNYASADLVAKMVGSGPHIDAGSPLRHAARFKSPVALFHGSRDLNVDVRHSRAMTDRLKDAGKQVSYTEYEGLEHSLRDSRVRTEMLIEIDRFLASALGN